MKAALKRHDFTSCHPDFRADWERLLAKRPATNCGFEPEKTAAITYADSRGANYCAYLTASSLASLPSVKTFLIKDGTS
jgi:hypothetical protein